MLCILIYLSLFMHISACTHTHTHTHTHLNTHAHTHTDDYKPLSVDKTKPGKLRVADDEVNVLLLLVQVCVKFYVCILVGSCLATKSHFWKHIGPG